MPKPIIINLLLVCTAISGLILGAGNAIAQTDTSQLEVGITVNYYNQANQIVNQQIKDVFSFFEGLNIQDPTYLDQVAARLTPPESVGNSQDCLLNLSSTCLQFKLNNLYQQYNIDLANIEKTEFIAEQTKVMVELNKQSIEFYQQVLFSYPIHIQNTQIKEQLNILIANLKDFEDAMKPYSNIFHNVTTSYCM